MTDYDSKLKEFLINEINKIKSREVNIKSPKLKNYNVTIESLKIYNGPINKDTIKDLKGVGQYFTNLLEGLINKFNKNNNNSSNSKNNSFDTSDNNISNDCLVVDDNDDTKYLEFLNYQEPTSLYEWAKTNDISEETLKGIGWKKMEDVSIYLITEDQVVKHCPNISLFDTKRLVDSAQSYFDFKKIQNSQEYIDFKKKQEENIKRQENVVEESIDGIPFKYYCLPPKVTEDMIKSRCRVDENYQRALEYYKKRLIVSIYIDGEVINSLCTSESELQKRYEVIIPFNNNTISNSYCVCDCEWKNNENWCKHKLSVLISISKFAQEHDDMSFITAKFINDEHINTTNRKKFSKTTSNPSFDGKVSSSRNKPHSSTSSGSYEPEYRSQNWGILMALYEGCMSNNQQYLSKDQIFVLANFHVDNKLTKDWYPKRLQDECYMSKEGNPPRYSITSKGISKVRELKSKLQQFKMSTDETDDDQNSLFNTGIPLTKYLPGDDPMGINNSEAMIIDQSLSSYYEWSDSDEELTDHMLNNSIIPNIKEFLYNETEIEIEDIFLVIDNREIKTTSQSNSNYTKILETLKFKKVKYELRNLPVGDFIWVAKVYNKSDQYKTSFELAFNTIIERKTLLDLKESINDGRYDGQKFKLKKIKFLPNIIYLIEGDNNEYGVFSSDEFIKHMVNIQVMDGFILKNTDSDIETINYLIALDNTFKKEPFKHLSNLRIGDLHQTIDNLNHLKLYDLFAQQLLQHKSINDIKAKSILSEYPTPFALTTSYNSINTEKEKEDLLETASHDGKHINVVGESVSKSINILWNSKSYE